VVVNTTSVHNQGLQDIFKDPAMQKRVQNTKSSVNAKALEELQKRLANEPERACYGPREVKRAIEVGAIDILMVSDDLFRNVSLQVRREYVDLVKNVKESYSSKAYVFSSGHFTGQQLAQLSGIAAILRFPVEYDEPEEAAAVIAPAVAAATADVAKPADKQPPQLSRIETAVETKSKIPFVAELVLALGPDVDEGRIEQALEDAKGIPEDAFLKLLTEGLDGITAGGTPSAAQVAEAVVFIPAADDVVEVLEEFPSSNKVPVQMPQGKIGKVIKVDDAGDAYIDFADLGKNWIKARHFGKMKKSQAKFAPPAREAPKASAKPVGKAGAKPAGKAKAKKAAMVWDDWDDY